MKSFLERFRPKRSTGDALASSDFFFGRRETTSVPLISVVCLNKNHRTFLETSILSVLSQNFSQFEIIVVDGGSTDGSREFLKGIPFIRLIDDPNSSRYKGILRGYAEARGEIVMITTSTDGYLCRGWFQKVYDTLRDRPEISLVWGSSATMNSDDTLGSVVYPRDPSDVPQMQGMFDRWIENGIYSAYLPELNYGIRRRVLESLLVDTTYLDPQETDPVLHVLFEFYRQGYLPFYLPVTANFGRDHTGQLQHSPEYKRVMSLFETACERHRNDISSGRVQHVFRGGNGHPIR